LCLKPWATEFDGTPCAVKAARTVWSGGKGGDYIKALPIAIRREVPGHEALNARLDGRIEGQNANYIQKGKSSPGRNLRKHKESLRNREVDVIMNTMKIAPPA
jgi:hypothetical protein